MLQRERGPAGSRRIARRSQMFRPRHDDLVRHSLHDLAEDFEELAYIARSTRARLKDLDRSLEAARRHIHPASARPVLTDVRSLAAAYARREAELEALRAEAHGGECSSDVRRLTQHKRTYAELIRTTQGRAAWLATATDWQSPSIRHSVHPNAGRHTGRVTEHLDDYRRDRHPDAVAFETAYLREYVDTARGCEARALMTSCGMAAFTTILGWLALEDKALGGIVAGGAMYHECKDLVRKAFGRRVREVDESDPEELLAATSDPVPGVVFLDSLCNSSGVSTPDLERLIAQLQCDARDDVYVVIDNTGLSASCQPFAFPGRNPLVHVIVFESLTKYAQFGLDRATAGMIVAPPSDAAQLSGCREHLGTNVGDASPHLIPEPNRRMLERRLTRLGRNSHLVARSLQVLIDRRRGPFGAVAYPALPRHPSHAWARHRQFTGGFLTLQPSDASRAVFTHRAFLDAVLREGRRRRVPLVLGASFGLDTTRVYLTASHTAHAKPFLRIAPGTEHRSGIADVIDVLATAMEKVCTR
ncbi:MAG: PLP-dependent transferase [Actinomycetota bacterium]